MKPTVTTAGGTVASVADSTVAEGSTIGVVAGLEGAVVIAVVEEDSVIGEAVVAAAASAIEEAVVAAVASATGEVVVGLTAAAATAGEAGAETGAAAGIATRGEETEEDSTTEEVSMTEKVLGEEIILKTRK